MFFISRDVRRKFIEDLRRDAMDIGAVDSIRCSTCGQLRSGKTDEVRADVKAVCDAAHTRGVKVKAIFEKAYLTDEQKIRACKLSEAAGADWVKTSTEFAPSGATLEDLKARSFRSRPLGVCAPWMHCWRSSMQAAPAAVPRPRRPYWTISRNR
jgi:deoxyribose-phosphate aldolase